MWLGGRGGLYPRCRVRWWLQTLVCSGRQVRSLGSRRAGLICPLPRHFIFDYKVQTVVIQPSRAPLISDCRLFLLAGEQRGETRPPALNNTASPALRFGREIELGLSTCWSRTARRWCQCCTAGNQYYIQTTPTGTLVVRSPLPFLCPTPPLCVTSPPAWHHRVVADTNPSVVPYKTPPPTLHLPVPLPAMVTHWKTDPIMDNPLTRPSTQGLKRPQVFVKVEFGVSWSAQHAPRKHGLEYKSRALRERAANFPRHVPAPTTNYLQHRRPQHRAFDAEQNAAQQNLLPPDESLFYPTRPTQVNFAPEPDVRFPTVIPRRRSRATVRPPSLDRHDRGHSAPPPLSDNNWDISVQSYQSTLTAHALAAGSSTACATVQRPRSDVWKDLPETPSRFRLGEDELPWEGTWAFPMGWEPFLEPDPYLQPPSSSHTSSARPQSYHPARPESRDDELPSTPTVVKIESPIDSPRLLQTDPSRRSDLEALGSAMMTVDNGFENQWWNQGQREVIPTAIHPPRSTSNHQAQEQMALGWVGALLPPGSDNQRFEGSEPTTDHSHQPSFSTMVVSPVSSYNGPVPGLSRALSTRSDELWFSSPRFA